MLQFPSLHKSDRQAGPLRKPCSLERVDARPRKKSVPQRKRNTSSSRTADQNGFPRAAWHFSCLMVDATSSYSRALIESQTRLQRLALLRRRNQKDFPCATISSRRCAADSTAQLFNDSTRLSAANVKC